MLHPVSAADAGLGHAASRELPLAPRPVPHPDGTAHPATPAHLAPREVDTDSSPRPAPHPSTTPAHLAAHETDADSSPLPAPRSTTHPTPTTPADLAAHETDTAASPRTDVGLAGFALWGGWLVVTGAVFSLMQGIFHGYYTVALAPAVAALVGMGAAALWVQATGGVQAGSGRAGRVRAAAGRAGDDRGDAGQADGVQARGGRAGGSQAGGSQAGGSQAGDDRGDAGQADGGWGAGPVGRLDHADQDVQGGAGRPALGAAEPRPGAAWAEAPRGTVLLRRLVRLGPVGVTVRVRRSCSRS